MLHGNVYDCQAKEQKTVVGDRLVRSGIVVGFASLYQPLDYS